MLDWHVGGICRRQLDKRSSVGYEIVYGASIRENGIKNGGMIMNGIQPRLGVLATTGGRMACGGCSKVRASMGKYSCIDDVQRVLHHISIVADDVPLFVIGAVADEDSHVG